MSSLPLGFRDRPPVLAGIDGVEIRLEREALKAFEPLVIMPLLESVFFGLGMPYKWLSFVDAMTEEAGLRESSLRCIGIIDT